MPNIASPFPIQASGVFFGAQPMYNLFGSLFGAGVIGSTHYAVAQHAGGANYSVDVAPGAAFVQSLNGYGNATSDLRFVQMTNLSNNGGGNADWTTTNATNVFATADSTNPRIDQVVLLVNDSGVDSSGLFTANLGILTGTPTSGASLSNLVGLATLPTQAIRLAYILISAGQTSITTAKILDARTRASIGRVTTDGFGATARPLFLASPTTFPTGSLTGDLMAVRVSSTSNYGVDWMFHYNGANSATNPWEFVGGPPLMAQTTASDTTTSTSYTTSGFVNQPTITVPRAGYYIIRYSAQCSNSTATASVTIAPSSDTLVAADANAAKSVSPAANNIFTVGAETPPLALGLSDTLTLSAKVSSGTGTIQNRTIALVPVSVV